MSDAVRYRVVITYKTDPGMLGRDGRKHPAETAIIGYTGLKSSEVRTLIREHMEAGEITPMNSLRPFDVHVEPIGWEDLQKRSSSDATRRSSRFK